MKISAKIILPVLLSVNISACAPIIIGGAATAGYLGLQERGAKTAVIDSKIKTGIKDKLFGTDYHYLTDVGVSVLQGDVLLTGIVKNSESVSKIEKMTYLIDGVNNVYNNLIVANKYSATDYSKDTLIATTFKTRMLGAKDVYSINYLSDTVLGNLYILGIASSESEKERVLYIARTTKGVKQVYNYIRIAESK